MCRNRSLRGGRRTRRPMSRAQCSTRSRLLTAPELVARTWATAKRDGEDEISEREVTVLLATSPRSGASYSRPAGADPPTPGRACRCAGGCAYADQGRRAREPYRRALAAGEERKAAEFEVPRQGSMAPRSSCVFRCGSSAGAAASASSRRTGARSSRNQAAAERHAGQGTRTSLALTGAARWRRDGTPR